MLAFLRIVLMASAAFRPFLRDRNAAPERAKSALGWLLLILGTLGAVGLAFFFLFVIPTYQKQVDDQFLDHYLHESQPPNGQAQDLPHVPEGNPQEQQAINAIKWLGGKVSVNENDPARRVSSVDLSSSKVTDSDLTCLESLTALRTLDLRDTKVSDAGLERLKGLDKLEELNLSWTGVTAAGLVHLKGLKNLETLRLFWTGVTDADIADLQTALPKLAIRK